MKVRGVCFLGWLGVEEVGVWMRLGRVGVDVV